MRGNVTQLSVKEADDIFEVRRTLLGAMIGRLTVPKAFALATNIDADIRALDALAQDPDGGPAYFETMFRLTRMICEACSNDRMSEILGSFGTPDVALQPTRFGNAGAAQRVSAQLANRAKGPIV